MITIPESIRRAYLSDANKNIRLVFSDGTPTITNNNLLKESFSFEERTCSADELKFGLCEGAAIEFEAFGISDISGKTFSAYVDVGTNSIPLGIFTVDKCAIRQVAGETFYKVTAYNGMKGEYLDANISVVRRLYDGRMRYSDNYRVDVCVGDVPNIILSNYGIAKKYNVEALVGGDCTYKDSMVSRNYSIGTDVPYGIDSPFSGYYLGSEMHLHSIWVGAAKIEYNLSADQVYKVNFLQDMAAYEQTVYDFLKDSIDDAELNYSGAEIISQITSGAGWQSLCAVILTTADEKIENYSTIATVNSSKRTGTFRDLSNRLLYGYTKLTLVMPYRFVIADNSPLSQTSPVNPINLYLSGGSEANLHLYYTDASMEETASSYNPVPPTFPDGTVNNADNESISRIIGVNRITNALPTELIKIDPDDVRDINARQIANAIYETGCMFSSIKRTANEFYAHELNQGGLLPADTLYPANDLYPAGADESVFRNNYESLASGKSESFRYLIITYKSTDSDGNEVEETLQRTVNTNGTTDYYMSDNWLFKNLVWTASAVGTYADAMVDKMQNLTWCQFELEGTGLPHLESGDMLEIQTGSGRVNTYILNRRLKGIQRMTDTYSNGSVDTF